MICILKIPFFIEVLRKGVYCSVKKILKRIVLAILILVIGMEGFFFFHRLYLESFITDEYNISNAIFGNVRIFNLCEKNDIEIDSEYKDMMKEHYLTLMKRLRWDNLSSETTIQLLCINEYYGLQYGDKLRNLLKQYYYDELELFTEYPVKNYTDIKKSEKEEAMSWIDSNYFLFLYLKRDFDIDLEYNLQETLENWFNENIKTLNKKDKDYDDIESSLISVLFSFYEMGISENLNFEKMKLICMDYVKKDVDNMKKIIKKNTLENLCELKAFDTIYKLFYNDPQYETLVKDMYRKLQTEEAFGYAKDDFSFVQVFPDFMQHRTGLKENQYFVEHINQWLWDNYNTCFKEEFKKEMK